MIYEDLEEEEKRIVDQTYPVGEVIEVDNNYCKCAKWEIGEQKCSCGNQLIYLEIQKDGRGNLWAYPCADLSEK